jgi:hypothetical protein
MKIEEVLPAMRAGKLAIDRDGDKWRLSATDGLQVFSSGYWVNAVIFEVDGWTLEPEPKVEWPKGSLQWALSQAAPGKCVRRGPRDRDGVDLKRMPYTMFGEQALMALDWEVAT